MLVGFFAYSCISFFYLVFHQVHNVKNRCYLTDVWHFSKRTWWVHVKLLYDWNVNLIYKRSIFFQSHSLKIYIFLWFDTIGCSEIFNYWFYLYTISDLLNIFYFKIFISYLWMINMTILSIFAILLMEKLKLRKLCGWDYNVLIAN